MNDKLRDRIVKHYNKYASVADTARRFGLTHSQVYSVLHHAGVLGGSSVLYKRLLRVMGQPGVTRKRAAEIVECSEALVYYYFPAGSDHPGRVRAESTKLALDLVDSGETVGEASRRSGAAYDTVKKALYRRRKKEGQSKKSC